MNLGKESETVEFKKTTGELKEGVISISSILNKHGVGTLYFGVKTNGDVVGQTVCENSLRDVSRVIYETIRPQIYPVISEEIIDDCHLIKVEFNGNDRPYSAYGRYYLRTADEDREVTPSELKNFFIADEYKDKWEKTKTNYLSSQIDKKAIKNFYLKAIESGRLPQGKYTSSLILNKFGLVDSGYLTNAGNVLFGNNNPVTLKAAIFATDEKLTFLDMQMYEDNIFNLLSLSENYILKNIRWRINIVGMEREEIPEIPVAVIREAIANSFAHAIYNGNTYHEICIHPDKVTIYSPGAYASPFMPEEYIKKDIQSSIRNATISKILYLNNSIEQFGSGFKRIDSLCKDSKVKYSYEANEYGFKLIFYRKNDGLHINDNDINYVNLNSTEEAVYNLLNKNPAYTRDQLAQSTSKTTRTIQRVLDSLRKKNLIQRIGSDKDGHWKIMK